jgi:hypothetical protein
MMSMMWPRQHEQKKTLYYLFSYAMMYISIALMYIVQEPMLCVMAAFAAIYAVAQSIQVHNATERGIVPEVWGGYIFFVIWMFLTPDVPQIDELANTFTRWETIEDSQLPQGYLSVNGNVLTYPLIVALIMGIFCRTYLSMGYKLNVSLCA